MAAGSQVAHVLAYRLVYPDAQVRLRSLLATGHGYMLGRLSYLPLVLGVVFGLELVAVGWSVFGNSRGRPSRPTPAWAFALLPLICFTVQELMERLLELGSLPSWLVLDPTFRIGLLLQLPFGLAAFLVARLLTRVVEGITRLLRPARPPATASVPRPRWSVRVAWLPRPALLASGHAVRGPPLLLTR